MNIAIVVESFPKLSETFVLNHIQGLLEQGHLVRVFAFNKGDGKDHPVVKRFNMLEMVHYRPAPSPNVLFRLGRGLKLLIEGVFRDVKLTISSLDFFNDPKNTLKLNRLHDAATFFSADHFDLIHVHFGTMANRFLPYKAGKWDKIPMGVSFHGYDINGDASNQINYDSLKVRADFFIANSEITKEKLLVRGFPSEKIHTIPVPLDTEFFSRKTPVFEDRKKNLILSTGRLIELKGFEFGIKAIDLLVKRGISNIEYLIIGDGPESSNLKRLIKDLDLQGYVKLAGSCNQTEVRGWMEQATIFIMPGIIDADGRAEAQGLVVQEAQAMELPVIVTDAGGMKEGMIDGQTGFIVPQRSPDALAGKIEYLLNNEKIRIEMGKSGRNFVARLFGLAPVTCQLLNLYSEVLKSFLQTNRKRA